MEHTFKSGEKIRIKHNAIEEISKHKKWEICGVTWLKMCELQGTVQTIQYAHQHVASIGWLLIPYCAIEVYDEQREQMAELENEL